MFNDNFNVKVITQYLEEWGLRKHKKQRFDYAKDNVVGVVKSRLRALAPLHSTFLEIAAHLAVHENALGFVLIVDSAVSEARLQQEWQTIVLTVRQDIVQRMALFKHEKKTYLGWPQGREPQLRVHLDAALNALPVTRSAQLPRPDYFSIILKILIQHWLTGTPSIPLTAKLIGQLAGCSFPTVKSALDRLNHLLHKAPGGGIELKRFPAPEWQALILDADRVRATKRYQDRSGRPRSPAFLIERLAGLHRENVAVGGVTAALDFYPELDLVGSPRLDLCIHVPGKYADLSFIEELDPALQESSDPEAPVYLALHFVRSKESYFSDIAHGLKRAGLVECMLDLHEMRFSDQANDWMDALLKQRAEL